MVVVSIHVNMRIGKTMNINDIQDIKHKSEDIVGLM